MLCRCPANGEEAGANQEVNTTGVPLPVDAGALLK
jgi:hypothetical protein